MKLPINLLAVILLMAITPNLHAQNDLTTIDSTLHNPITTVDNDLAVNKSNKIRQSIPLNMIKVNVAALLFKSYALQYERVLNRKFSVAIQYRIMPESGIPFKSHVLKLMGDVDDNTKKVIEEFRMSNFAITPEVKLYLSRKGYGRGFYLAPFYRYASFTSNQLNVFYTDDNDVEQSIKLSGKLTSNTFGLAIGAQNALGKNIVLDWSLLGPHLGTGKGNFIGASTKPLSPDEQADVRKMLEDIDIPLADKTVNVDANGASMKIDGPWAGIRFTIGLGVRF